MEHIGEKMKIGNSKPLGDILGDLWERIYDYTVGEQTFEVLSGSGTAEYLVVGGGGAGGSFGGGGGGGVITGTKAVSIGQQLKVYVGKGGCGIYYIVAEAGNGQNSYFDDIVSAGGGRGGGASAGTVNHMPTIGASGGGGKGIDINGVGAAGIAGQGYAGGNGTSGGTQGGGGAGGGAGAVGGNAGATTGGVGGVGVASSISGSSVYYGGGGGGGAYIYTSSGDHGDGGLGGGGRGGDHNTGQGLAGTANTGGGGGGSGYGASGYPMNYDGPVPFGGSGIVIVRYLTGSLTATGGTISTSGSYTIHTFTVGTNVTTLTISGLDGDTDEEYILESKMVNGYNGVATANLKINNDGGTNYGYQYFDGTDSTATAARGTAAFLNALGYGTVLGGVSLTAFRIFAKSGFVRTVINERCGGISGTTVTEAIKFGQSWNNTADNITSLVITANQTGGLGVGSSFQLYRKSRRS